MSNDTLVTIAGICVALAVICGLAATRRWPTIYLGFSLMGYLLSLAALVLMVVALARG